MQKQGWRRQCQSLGIQQCGVQGQQSQQEGSVVETRAAVRQAQAARRRLSGMGFCRADAAWPWEVWTNHSTAFHGVKEQRQAGRLFSLTGCLVYSMAQ